MYVIDFETLAIGARPQEYPPKPVGLAWFNPATGESGYKAFGHPENNNCTFEEARAFLASIWGQEVLIMHNAQFDLEVAQKHFGLPPLTQECFEDTLMLAFLFNPHENSFALKDLAQAWLKVVPEERDELREWILANVPGAKRAPTKWGAHIAKAPVEIVAPYAVADCTLTYRLYGWLMVQPAIGSMLNHTLDFPNPSPDEPKSYPPGTLNCYERIKAASQIMTANSAQGILIDMPGIEAAIAAGEESIQKATEWVYNKLNIDETVNIDSDAQLTIAIMASKCWDTEIEWPKTDKGAFKADKHTLDKMLIDRGLQTVLAYRGLMSTTIRTFLKPWHEAGKDNGGRIHTNWNMVRARTGRMSSGGTGSAGNFQNIPREPEQLKLPADLLGCSDIPNPRAFLLPDPGHVLISADFSGQELRIFAHFTGGPLAEKYKSEPNADMHTYTAELMQPKCPFTITRQHAKGLNFGILYGAGAAKLGVMLGVSPEEGRMMLDTYKREVAPNLSALQAQMKIKDLTGERFRTLGRRLVPIEPPTLRGDRWSRNDFKATNYLVQGSGADMTLQALVEYERIRDSEARIYLVIHDEIVLSVPEDKVESERLRLTQAMCTALPLRVPMLADAHVGKNLAECK